MSTQLETCTCHDPAKLCPMCQLEHDRWHAELDRMEDELARELCEHDQVGPCDRCRMHSEAGWPWSDRDEKRAALVADLRNDAYGY